MSMCQHNNLKNLCPRCLSNKKMGLTIPAYLPSRAEASSLRGMGDCKPGYFQVIPGADWSCAPNSDTLIKQELAKVGAQAAQTEAVKEASIAAAGEALGTKIVRFYRQNPVIAWGLTAGVVGLMYVGAKSFMKRKMA